MTIHNLGLESKLDNKGEEEWKGRLPFENDAIYVRRRIVLIPLALAQWVSDYPTLTVTTRS